MTALSDFPRIHLLAAAPDNGARMQRVDPQDAATLKQIASEHKGTWIAVVDEGVRLWPESMNLTPEPALLGTTTCIGYLSRNEMNGFARQSGLRLCRRDRISKTGKLPEAELLVPKFIGHWSVNAGPEAAFCAGVAETSAKVAELVDGPAARQDLGLWASLGADTRNGIWWLLGVNLALLYPDHAKRRWAEAKPLSDNPADLALWLTEVAREVRLERSIPVRPMSPEQSRSAKLMLSPWPAPHFWTRFAEDCARLGEDGAKLAADYLRAADYIWGPLPG